MIIIIYNHHSDQNPKKTKITWVCSYYLKTGFRQRRGNQISSNMIIFTQPKCQEWGLNHGPKSPIFIRICHYRVCRRKQEYVLKLSNVNQVPNSITINNIDDYYKVKPQNYAPESKTREFYDKYWVHPRIYSRRQIQQSPWSISFHWRCWTLRMLQRNAICI